MKIVDQKILEAVPNVSAGADPAVVEQLVSAASSGGSFVAHVDTSISANRSVITLFGGPDEVVASCRALITAAASTIDMSTHTGTHPCVGAIDVAPFIPMSGATMEDAIACARRLAEWAGTHHQLPVFLYGIAATTPAHQSLPYLRRGGLDGLAARLAHGTSTPDYGPPITHPRLGALITGAREILIAYNIQLSTTDATTASQIAAAVRTAGPAGRPFALPALRAIGWYEEGYHCAEVSCNLLDYRVTNLQAVWDAVSTVARSFGFEAVSSDVIGLVPAAALEAPGISREQYVKRIRLGVCRPFEVERRTVEAGVQGWVERREGELRESPLTQG